MIFSWIYVSSPPYPVASLGPLPPGEVADAKKELAKVTKKIKDQGRGVLERSRRRFQTQKPLRSNPNLVRDPTLSISLTLTLTLTLPPIQFSPHQ